MLGLRVCLIRLPPSVLIGLPPSVLNPGFKGGEFEESLRGHPGAMTNSYVRCGLQVQRSKGSGLFFRVRSKIDTLNSAEEDTQQLPSPTFSIVIHKERNWHAL